MANPASRPAALRRQRPVTGRILVTLGIISQVIAGILFLLLAALSDESVTLPLPDYLWDLLEAGTPLLFVLAPAIALMVAGGALVRAGRRHLVATHDARAPHEVAAPVLYLRPFVTDTSPARYPLKWDAAFFQLMDKKQRAETTLWFKGVRRYEELLAYAFERVGPFVAIGDPREPLPLLGATRIYAASTGAVDDASWKTAIGQQIESARFILLHVGTTEGLRWEIERVVRAADPQRVVLCIEPAGKSTLGGRLNSNLRARLQREWSQFIEACGSVFPRQLPASVGDARFVRFDADWNAVPVQASKYKLLWFAPGRDPDISRSTAESALTWLTWILVQEPFRRRFARKLINFITFIAIFLLAIVAFVVLLDALNPLGPPGR